jgi:hypothetical protein
MSTDITNSPSSPSSTEGRGRCIRCGGEQQDGRVMAPAYRFPGVLIHPNQAYWYGSQPTSGFWGISMSPDKRPLAAWRCTSCGLLEFYA